MTWLRSSLALVAESVRIAASMPVMSALLGLASGFIVASSIVTLGDTIVTERSILADFENEATRAIYIDDVNSASGFPQKAVNRLANISGVEWVVALGVPFDVHVPHLDSGEKVPARAVIGEPPGIAFSPTDRPGAFVSEKAARRLGLISPAGSLESPEGVTLGIAGTFNAKGVLQEFDSGVLIRTSTPTPIRRLILSAKYPEQVTNIAALAIDSMGRQRHDVEVTTSMSIVAAGEVVRGKIGEANRRFVLTTLGIGVILGAVVSFVSVSLRRRDFGRRRALGATRLQLISVVIVAAGIAVITGAVAGSTITLAWFRYANRPIPPLDFILSTMYVTTLLLITSTAIPASFAAFRDPVTALRVP